MVDKMGTGMANSCIMHRRGLALASGLGVMLLSGQALAAGASEPGLPQLDITTWPSQIFWLVVIFGVGYVMMSKVVTPKIGTVLEERRNRLDDDLGKARDSSAEAAKVRAEYEAGLEQARSDAAQFAREAAAEAAQNAATVEGKAAKKLAAKVSAAEAKLVEARDVALESLNGVAGEAAIDAVQGLTGMKATKAQAEKTVASIAKSMASQEAN
ncbi:F0F1 ATP synthase subunit B' [Alphaproteobacteria bacterium]|jgi:F-type H+-transporting ATPase subunit b|nr:F0F1 ATP synthase subunit B' [Alphaproteobacteria bacterium]